MFSSLSQSFGSQQNICWRVTIEDLVHLLTESSQPLQVTRVFLLKGMHFWPSRRKLAVSQTPSQTRLHFHLLQDKTSKQELWWNTSLRNGGTVENVSHWRSLLHVPHSGKRKAVSFHTLVVWRHYPSAHLAANSLHSSRNSLLTLENAHECHSGV